MMRWMLIVAAAGAAGAAIALAVPGAHTSEAKAADPSVQRGRYLVRIGGCNDCHTPGYTAKAGQVPEDQWLTGASLGFSGPWGTTYPSNLRRQLGAMDEDSWVRFASTIKTRPPMPWFNLRDMREDDLRAMYRYVRSLPPSDRPVPGYVPPGRRPTTPHIVMTPRPPQR
jgi:mono/diheme cytochrome c family protein